MKKILSIGVPVIIILAGLAAYLIYSGWGRGYKCPQDATLNCVAGGAPGSICKNSAYLRWAIANCKVQILE